MYEPIKMKLKRIIPTRKFEKGHLYGKEKNILKDSLDLLNTCKNTGNTHVSISWHPRTCSKDYNWHYGYEKLVKIW